MFRHVTAPARYFSQLPNEIIRHPRLTSDAVRLLAWQLSLPGGANEPLSRTAARAGIGKTAFQRAKRQLLDEGYLHEWRRQGERGRWRTVQLISNVVVSAADARALWDGGIVTAPKPTQKATPAPVPPAVPAAQPPAAALPAAGPPTGQAVGRQPRTNTTEYTPHPPDDASRLAEAEALLRSLGSHEPRLVMPARKARAWAPLAAEWLASCLSPELIRQTLTHGLDKARSPLGALRWRLEHALPEQSYGPPPPQPRAPEPRIARMRECTGAHTQPRLFAPSSADDELCPGCRDTPTAAAPPGPGLRAFRTARAGARTDTRTSAKTAVSAMA
ncbi:hypothetical protein DVA86_10170 [Streptomyces armeniacus]|uniref:Helix-turn-helix domain-containing protein n=1 Tax=Streptomyces armeniacus TaxID=83291 RepID=A0A345XMU7_9ACTN|nr:hypothetical protein [Streptomyces armeniacus]AXK32963.1 hypothetical protein DVA86_10170 [Streptomyces armeniacus]